MMEKKQITSIILVSVLLMSVVLSTGCTEQDGENGEDDQTVVIAQTSGPDVMDPMEYSSMTTHTVFNHMFDPLIRNTPDGLPNTDGRTVAEDFSVSDDGLTYTFQIKEGVLFHHGEELDAEDVAFTIELDMGTSDIENAPDSPNEGGYSSVDYVEATDDYEVQIHMKEVDAEFLVKEHFEMFNVVPKDYIVENGYDEYLDHLYGTGPYEFTEYVGGQQVLMEGNDQIGSIDEERYEDGTPAIENIRMEFYDDVSSAITRLQAGEVHFIESVQPDMWEQLEGDDNVVADTFPTNSFDGILFEQTEPPFDDPRVRKAFAYALDMDKIVDYMGEEFIEPSRTPVFPGMAGSPNQDEIPQYEQDIEKAKELLAEAGYPDGIETEFVINEDILVEQAQVIQGDLSEAGIDIEIRQVNWGRLLEILEAGNAPLSWSGFGGGASIYSRTHYWTSSSGLNWYIGSWNTEEYDSLMSEALRTVDIDERLELFAEAQKVMVDDMATFITYGENNPFVYHESLTIAEEYKSPYDRSVGPILGADLWELEE